MVQYGDERPVGRFDEKHTLGALKEGGDLVIPLKAGLITEAAIRADLADLARGQHKGRVSEDEVTLFKSVGTAIEDFAAARLAMQRLN